MPWRMVMLTTLAMLAFAGNSLLARAALKMTVLDPASFTTLRLASGALASGLGYALWYAVLPAMRPFQAASVQLTVPVLAALGGILLLNEPLTVRLVVASAAVLTGIWMVIRRKAAV